MQVYELLRDTFIEMGLMDIGLVTGSPSKTVITDANAGLTADLLINGTLMALGTGEFQRISDNTATTITIDTALAASASTGDSYGFIKDEFKTPELIFYVNMALRKIGNIGVTDTSTTTAASKTEYDLPKAIKAGNIRGVYINGKTDDLNDYQWIPIPNWRIQPSTAGSVATIIFKEQYVASRTILIEYIGLHAAVTAYSSEIDEAIHPDLAKAALKLTLANRRTERASGQDDGFNQLYNKLKDEFDEAVVRHPIAIPDRTSKIFQGRGTSIYPDVGEPNKVDLS